MNQIYIVSGEADPSDINALDFIVASAKEKVAKLEKRIEDLSVADEPDEAALDAAYEELEVGVDRVSLLPPVFDDLR